MKHTAATVSIILSVIVFYLLSPPFIVWLIIHLPGGFSETVIKVLSFVYTPARILGSYFPIYLDFIATESAWLGIPN